MIEPTVRLPSELEISRNLQASTRMVWGVERAYEVTRSKSAGCKILRPADPVAVRRFYAPMVEPDLVEEFAQAVNEDSLKKFAGRFGLLGFQNISPRKPGPGGDPVEWALTRARETRVSLEIQSLLEETQKTGRDTELHRELPKLLRKIGFLLNPETKGSPPHSRWRYTDSWPNDPARTAWQCLGDIINPHLRRVRFEILPGETGSLPSLMLHFDALIDVIAWRLATQLRKLKPYLCESCGRLAFARRGSKKTCSLKCRKAKWRLERKTSGLSRKHKRRNR